MAEDIQPDYKSGDLNQPPTIVCERGSTEWDWSEWRTTHSNHCATPSIVAFVDENLLIQIYKTKVRSGALPAGKAPACHNLQAPQLSILTTLK